LTGNDPFISMSLVDEEPGFIRNKIVYEPKHEGFIGIPHGGLGMGLCVDAWRSLRPPEYPVDIKFKFGGSGISIGDEAHFEVQTGNGDGRFGARIIKPGDKTPYLKAEFSKAESSDSYASFEEGWGRYYRSLPYYRNCFVCGHHRTIMGLQRRFEAHDAEGGPIVTVSWGQGDDYERAGNFLISSDELHPAVITSIFDENTAWGGFMKTRSCGLSVRMDLRLIRPVSRNEELIFVARPTGVRGNPKAPRFYLAEGAVYSLSVTENPQVVACGRGEWIIMDAYTQQIKKNLLPEDDWQWLFTDPQGPETN
jgi:acyl-coenzyme A thioesterase PaaI-like protein